MSTAEEKALYDGLGKASRKALWDAIIAVIIVAITIIGTIAWLNARSIPHPSEHPSKYTKHTTILIGGDSDFVPDNGVVGGNGTAADPYIIAGWDIESSTLWDGRMAGIQIMNANAHFTVRNCHISETASNRDWGIYLASCVNGTLENNNCSDNECGIYLTLSSNITISNNSCSSNAEDGIHLSSSSNIKMFNNSCSHDYNGISLVSSSNNTLGNNNCSSNSYNGIAFLASNNNTLIGNNCSMNFNGGMTLYYSSSNNTLSDNNCSSNYAWGIGLASSSNNNEMSWNQVWNNRGCAVDISSGSNHSRIWYNVIIGNNGATATYNISRAQARDDGTNNSWNSTDAYGSHGNYWSDWTTPDAVPPQGIVDHPYTMLGSAGAKDYYPLSYNPRIIGISFIPSWRS